MSIENKLKEIFELFKYFEFKGVPMEWHPFNQKVLKLKEELLLEFGLPIDQSFDRIFFEMNRHLEWNTDVYQEAIDNLHRSSLEYKNGQTRFRSILRIPKSPLQHGAVYLSDRLIYHYTDFLNKINIALMSNHVFYQFLWGTKDIWVRDFMPVQAGQNKYVQFVYDPDYLKGKWSHLKSDPWKVTVNLDIAPLRSNLVIDGGNVIRCHKSVILTEKIFAENPSLSKPDLIKQISNELEVENVVLIPIEPEDYTGHSDGMVRFIGENSVIINDYLIEDGYSVEFITLLRYALESKGLKIVGTLPYRSMPRKNKDGDFTAIGCYMNFLEVENLIIFPAFGIEEDDVALKKVQKYFPLKKIIQLDCQQIAEDGGVLNCVTWSV